MALKFLQADITQLEVDAIVNAANTELWRAAACAERFSVLPVTVNFNGLATNFRRFKRAKRSSLPVSTCPRNSSSTRQAPFGTAVNTAKNNSCAPVTPTA